MKTIFTLIVLAVTATFSNAQVVMNEVYTDPGNNKSEFFEFYNTSNVAQNMDNFTLVTYYEESGNVGFYVMDLPNQTIAPNGYYVGASSNPFDVQGQNNIPADLNWNAIPAGGSLKKFQKNGATYTQVAVPANLNDFFVTVTGNGASQSILVFNNGSLINGIFGGMSSSIIPANIKAMPPLFIDMSGASPDFLIDFSSYNNNQFEYITSVTGNDNGFARSNDGKCGVWYKTSSSNQHTPGKTNGSASGVSGDLTITAYITELTGQNDKSLLIYNITAGSLAAFPVTVEASKDMGTIGQLDAGDSLVDSRQITSITAGDQYIILPFRNDPVMLAAKTPSGCYDQVIAIQNSLSAAATLPVHLISFQGNLNKNNKVTLTWTAAENETVDHFEVERSVNGKDFTTASVVFTSEKKGTEDYLYFETLKTNDKVMYRLKMFDKGQEINYSKILVFQPNTANSNNAIKIFGNPVTDKLTFSYISSATQIVDVKVYDMSGKTVMSQKVNSLEGSNMISLPLNSSFKTGMYIVEVNNSTDRQIAKFAK